MPKNIESFDFNQNPNLIIILYLVKYIPMYLLCATLTYIFKIFTFDFMRGKIIKN